MARWYIIHAYSGFENKVRDAIIAEAERLGLSEGVEEVEVPTETITEDMHTGIRMSAYGWRTVYVSERLIAG